MAWCPTGCTITWGRATSLEATRPAGVFCLRPGAGDMVAFGAGSGITPVISLIKTALATTTRRVRLLYANRDRNAVIFRLSSTRSAALRRPPRGVHHFDADRGCPDRRRDSSALRRRRRVLHLRSRAVHGHRRGRGRRCRRRRRAHPHRAVHARRVLPQPSHRLPRPAGATRVTIELGGRRAPPTTARARRSCRRRGRWVCRRPSRARRATVRRAWPSSSRGRWSCT